MNNIYYWKDLPNCRVKASCHVYSWKTISDLNNPKKTKGWLLPEKDFMNLITKKFEQVVLSVKLDYGSTEQVVLSNYVPYHKNKLIKETEQIVFCIDDRTYKPMPVIYKKGVVKCGRVYMAFTYQNRIIDISQVDIFILSKYK